ncbi:MAG: DnaD domain protein [Clostridia bacterium]|nr:DnaD domain protein [Clostridia bacterium]
MKIQVAPAAWGKVFAVPSSVVEEHLRFASGQQLKVLLYVLAQGGEALELRDIAEGLGMPESEVSDAMQYWVATGYLERDGAEAPTPAPKQTPVNRGGKTEPLLEVPDIVPTYETVAARLLEDPELKAMFQEVQALMGKTIGYDTQAKFIMMHDSYGLPPEVILTIVEYATRQGKGVGYICKVGKNWAEDGVTTLEDAMEKLEKLASTDKVWSEFRAQFSSGEAPKATDQRKALLRKWRCTYGQTPELIYYAYETMVEAIDKVNFNYMDKILTRWNEEGLRTPQDVMQAGKTVAPAASGGGTKTGTSRTKPRGAVDHHKASYDSDAYREKAQGPIEYKRKTKGEG